MNPQPQTRNHPNGDCMRACIASLMEIPIRDVPDFTLAPPDSVTTIDGHEYPSYYAALQGFLSTMNLTFVEISLTANMPWMPLPFGAMAIFVGQHKSGCKHAIVGRCLHGAFFPVFDPLLPDLDEDPFVGGIDGVCLLVQLDPFVNRRMGRSLEKVIELLGTSMGQIPMAIRDEALFGLGGDAALIGRDEQTGAVILGSDGRPANETPK